MPQSNIDVIEKSARLFGPSGRWCNGLMIIDGIFHKARTWNFAPSSTSPWTGHPLDGITVSQEEYERIGSCSPFDVPGVRENVEFVFDGVTTGLPVDRCSEYLDRFNNEKHDVGTANMVSEVFSEYAKRILEKNKVDTFICCMPGCFYTFTKRTSLPVIDCPVCGRTASVKFKPGEDVVIPPAVYFTYYSYLGRTHLDYRRFELMMGLLREGHVTLDNIGTFHVDLNTAPFAVKGKHFIRGRVNRHVLGEFEGISLRGSDLMYGPTNKLTMPSVAFLSYILRNPDVIVLPDLASTFRDECVSEFLPDEMKEFANKLKRKGVMKTSTSTRHEQINELLTSLYAIAKKDRGLKILIKKNGDVMFPTDEIAESIKPWMIERAFAASEHRGISEVGELFNVEVVPRAG